MDETRKINLKTSNITNVPLEKYEKDFTFIINGEEFKTNRLFADLLSSKLCKIHITDPTFDTYRINTEHPGDFSTILRLINFDQIDIPENQFPFFSEIFENLGLDSIDLQEPPEPPEITLDNVFLLIQKHQKSDTYNSKRLSQEIDFISQHFDEILETREESLANLSLETLTIIISNKNLHLATEDQLLTFANKLYKSDPTFASLYEHVFFENVSPEAMSTFLEVFDFNEMTHDMWAQLSRRLAGDENRPNRRKYKNMIKKKTSTDMLPEKSKKSKSFTGRIRLFEGIINSFIRDGSFPTNVEVSASSTFDDGDWCQPKNVTLFGDKSKKFKTKDEVNSWLCYDFKERRVVLKNYTIRSRDTATNDEHLKCWVIEGSNDQQLWEILDEKVDCQNLNGPSFVSTFAVENQENKGFRFIRLRQTGPNWKGNNFLVFEAFEVYGILI